MRGIFLFSATEPNASCRALAESAAYSSYRQRASDERRKRATSDEKSTRKPSNDCVNIGSWEDSKVLLSDGWQGYKPLRKAYDHRPTLQGDPANAARMRRAASGSLRHPAGHAGGARERRRTNKMSELAR
jgi:hypothetical protein